MEGYTSMSQSFWRRHQARYGNKHTHLRVENQSRHDTSVTDTNMTNTAKMKHTGQLAHLRCNPRNME